MKKKIYNTYTLLIDNLEVFIKKCYIYRYKIGNKMTTKNM